MGQEGGGGASALILGCVRASQAGALQACSPCPRGSTQNELLLLDRHCLTPGGQQSHLQLCTDFKKDGFMS